MQGGNQRCRACEHYILQYSYLLKGYVEGCDVDTCDFVNKKKKLRDKQKAFIKKEFIRNGDDT